MKNQFSKYIIQKMIDMAKLPQPQNCLRLPMDRIRRHVTTLHKYTYGKNAFQHSYRLKYYITLKPTPDFLPLTNGPLLQKHTCTQFKSFMFFVFWFACLLNFFNLWSSRRRFNSPTPTRRRVKSSRDVGELVFNPVQFIRS